MFPPRTVVWTCEQRLSPLIPKIKRNLPEIYHTRRSKGLGDPLGVSVITYRGRRVVRRGSLVEWNWMTVSVQSFPSKYR